MRFVTNLPSAECLKRLTNPTDAPTHIHIIISEIYKPTTGIIGKINARRHIYTRVNYNEFEVWSKCWSSDVNTDSEGIYARLNGSVWDSGRGYTIIEYRNKYCDSYAMLILCASLWIILLILGVRNFATGIVFGICVSVVLCISMICTSIAFTSYRDIKYFLESLLESRGNSE